MSDRKPFELLKFSVESRDSFYMRPGTHKNVVYVLAEIANAAIAQDKAHALSAAEGFAISIERLTRELEQVKALRLQDIQNLQQSQAERDSLLETACCWSSWVNDLITERDQLRAEVERLKAELCSFIDYKNDEAFTDALNASAMKSQLAEALEAIQRFASIKADDGDDFSRLDPQTIIRCEVTVADLTAARAFLEKHSGDATAS